MNARISHQFKTPLRTALVGLALVAAYGCTWAASPFTFSPTAAGLTGADFTADSIKISNYSHIETAGNSFTDIGLLAVTSFENNGAVVSPTGYGSSYGLYFSFNGAGTLGGNTNPTNGLPTFGTFDTLSFSMYAYSGPSATFTVPGGVPTVTGAGTPTLLATGSLINGSVGTIPDGMPPPGQQGPFSPFASVNLSFTPEVDGFFASPEDFYQIATSAFINVPANVSAGGATSFNIVAGGGSVQFNVSPIPEPETYALMLAGLVAVGFVARRRRNV